MACPSIGIPQGLLNGVWSSFSSEIIAKSRSEGEIVLLKALELSTAFDTVAFSHLFSISGRLGIEGTVLKLFTTYLHNRKTSEAIEDEWSGSITTHTGVPQGSILRPVLFTVHFIQWFHFLDSLNKYYNFDADDSQLIFDFDNNYSEIIERF